MLRSNDEEKEILLGNKQLLGIFFIVSLLLAVAFGGGHMVGRGSGDKAPATAASNPKTATEGTGGETHSLTPEPNDNSGSGNTAGNEPVNTPGTDTPPTP